MGAYIRYWLRMFRYAVSGSPRYNLFLGAMVIPIAAGAVAYWRQLEHGLSVTNMSDQVSWGAYIANFTFLVGVAAAAVLLVVPTYLYNKKEFKEVVILGELLAVSAIAMCLLFVAVDLGHPERFLHMIPGYGRLNLPSSILAWDVIVLNVYLVLNLHVPGYLLWQKYRGRPPSDRAYTPFVFTAMVWAISIHTVTAFLYSGLGGRPFWNAAILAPRFIISAFASGPAILVILFVFMNRYQFHGFKVPETVITYLKRVIAFTLPANVFLFMAEIFKELYTDTTHAESMRYLFVGIHGQSLVAPYMWASVCLSAGALVIFLTPRFRANENLALWGSAFCVVGIWIEKGMGLIVPGFIPTPMGDLVEYTPSWVEFFVSMGIWSFGILLFTVMARIATAIFTGRLSESTFEPGAE
jgi:molybdopterin-containing oxidoreductase family membrane subunit